MTSSKYFVVVVTGQGDCWVTAKYVWPSLGEWEEVEECWILEWDFWKILILVIFVFSEK